MGRAGRKIKLILWEKELTQVERENPQSGKDGPHTLVKWHAQGWKPVRI